MREGWRLIPLGEVATLDIEKVPVVPGTTYRIAGVLNAGKGMLRRDSIDGSETNYPALHQLRAGQLVMRKLTAWEGPITVVPEEYDGYVVSTEFPTFSLDSEHLLPAYMRLVCQQPTFWERMREGSTGTVQRRKRVNPSQLLQIEVLLPPLLEQRRVIDLLEALDRSLTAATDMLELTATQIASMSLDLVRWEDEPLVRLGDVVSIESSLVDPTLPEFSQLPHVGVDRIIAREGQLLRLGTAADDGVTSGKHYFTAADVIYSKIRPELRKAAFPRHIGLCSADAYPLRPGPAILPEYLLEVLLSDDFAQRSTAKSGRTKMPKLNRGELFSIEIPLPPLNDQHRVVGILGSLREFRSALTGNHEALIDLRSALLAELLSGRHSLPDSYDALLERAS